MTAEDPNERWLKGNVHGFYSGYWNGSVMGGDDGTLLWNGDLVIDLTFADPQTGGETILRTDDSSHCVFAIKFDRNGAAAVKDGRVQARLLASNDDELCSLAHGGTVRGIGSYDFYPALDTLAARAQTLTAEAAALGYKPEKPQKTASARDLAATVGALEKFAADAIEQADELEKPMALLAALHSLSADLVPARRRETVRTLLISTLRAAAAAVPALVSPREAALVEAGITAQQPAPSRQPAPPPPGL